MDAIQTYDADHLTIAVVSDLHINSTLGLCPEKILLDDGGYYLPSAFQEKLWKCWEDFWDQVGKERLGGELIVIVNGDAVDGDHHNTPQIVSRNLETQRQAGISVLSRPARMASALYIVRGTEVHVGKSAQAEEALAYDLNAVKTPEGRNSWWRLPISFSGVRFDFAHHGNMGRLPWTTNNMINRLAVEIELEYRRMELEPPNFAIRSHNHRWGDSSIFNPVKVISLAGWQGPTAHVHRIAPGALPQVGGLIFHIDNGAASFRVVSYTKDMPWLI
jgi:hypothetical protein